MHKGSLEPSFFELSEDSEAKRYINTTVDYRWCSICRCPVVLDGNDNSMTCYSCTIDIDAFFHNHKNSFKTA
jgi:hypothetical protein